MKKIIVIFLLLIISVPFFFSQDYDEIYFSYGEVIKITETQIVLREYSIEEDAEVDISYDISKNVEIYGVDSLTQIQTGSFIDIQFEIIKNKKTITEITFDNSSLENDENM